MRIDVNDFVEAVRSIRSTHAFNPYADVCPVADNVDSPSIRARNLAAVLEACLKAEKCSLWVARDLGYRGGRRTGVPLTDEVFLTNYGNVIGARGLKKATNGPVVAERTAHVTHYLVRQLNTKVFMWNVFPLHPHEPDDPFSNRKHTAAERDISRFAIEWLVSALKLDVVVAIGRDAQAALNDMGIQAYPARHPSYGGQRDFLEGISRLYGKAMPREQQLALI